jgi:phenylacetate-coenzyme A ligase PaaK-like adenylate-forming protein
MRENHVRRAPVTDYSILRQRTVEQFERLLPEHIARATWSVEQLRAERERGLRALLRVTKERSRWHRARLAHLDPETLTEADLASLPTMTKVDLMQNFDAILTVEDVTRERAEAHLEHLTEDAYLLDQYHVVASGGSSGTRGVFVFDWDGWLTCALTQQRFARLAQKQAGLRPDAVRAVIAGGKASHMSFAMASLFGRSGVVAVPATLPMREIVERLNALQPELMTGFPSMMHMLAREAVAGRLRVKPVLVMCGSEPLLPETRALIQETWNVRVVNRYFTSEGPSASDCGAGFGMHLNEDVCIFEPVNEQGRPVAIGERAAKLFVTPLFNLAQPLIRYELTDEIALKDATCPCGSGMRLIDDIGGRSDDSFTYAGGVVVHPMLFRSPMGRDRNIVEYQVHQTEHGASIDLRTDGDVDLDSLRQTLIRELRAVGISAPEVSIRIVSDFERQATGKLKRFVPLASP